MSADEILDRATIKARIRLTEISTKRIKKKKAKEKYLKRVKNRNNLRLKLKLRGAGKWR